MTNEEIKAALKERCDVVYVAANGVPIKGKVYAIRYSLDISGGIKVSAEIETPQSSLIICDPKRIGRYK